MRIGVAYALVLALDLRVPLELTPDMFGYRRTVAGHSGLGRRTGQRHRLTRLAHEGENSLGTVLSR